MQSSGSSVEDIIRLVRQLSPADRSKLIEQLGPALEVSPVAENTGALEGSVGLDDQYQRGYEQIPEDTADLEALLPHLPLPMESWE
jgi:hypothetical protein